MAQNRTKNEGSTKSNQKGKNRETCPKRDLFRADVDLEAGVTDGFALESISAVGVYSTHGRTTLVCRMADTSPTFSGITLCGVTGVTLFFATRLFTGLRDSNSSTCHTTDMSSNTIGLANTGRTCRRQTAEDLLVTGKCLNGSFDTGQTFRTIIVSYTGVGTTTNTGITEAVFALTGEGL